MANEVFYRHCTVCHKLKPVKSECGGCDCPFCHLCNKKRSLRKCPNCGYSFRPRDVGRRRHHMRKSY